MVQIKVHNKEDEYGRSFSSSSEAPLLGELEVISTGFSVGDRLERRKSLVISQNISSLPIKSQGKGFLLL
jgi:hypothetical protein